MDNSWLKAWRLSLPAGSRLMRPGPNPVHATQAEAADLLGVPVHTYRGWEQGRYRVPAVVRRSIDRIEEYEEEPD